MFQYAEYAIPLKIIILKQYKYESRCYRKPLQFLHFEFDKSRIHSNEFHYYCENGLNETQIICLGKTDYYLEYS